jgi:hypothetical protein
VSTSRPSSRPPPSSRARWPSVSSRTYLVGGGPGHDPARNRRQAV